MKQVSYLMEWIYLNQQKTYLSEDIFPRWLKNFLLSQIKKIPVVFLSGLHGQGVENLLDMILDVQQKLNLRISTSKLNRWLTPIIENNPPPLYKGKRNNIRYITQVNVRPPTFAIFMSSPENLPDSYKRYLMSSLMEDFGLSGLPIRLMARKGKNPYSDN